MDWSRLEPLLRRVDEKDESTAAHTARVALYMQALAESAGIDAESVKRLIQAALLHDIGKVDIPAEILRKPGPLDEREYAVMRTHTLLGHELLISLGIDDRIALELVRSHHERLDATGYPDRLAAEDIPTAAKYFAVIDSFDAMTSRRPYRTEIGPEAAERAIGELVAKAGLWYEPDAVSRFVDLYRTGQLDWIMQHLNGAESDAVLPALPSPEDVATMRKTLRG